MAELIDFIKNKDIQKIKEYMAANNLKLEGNKLVPIGDDSKKILLQKRDFWNQRQQARRFCGFIQ